jgi:surface protein
MSIADELNTLVNCKEDMKSALIEKGVTPEGGLSTYADAIDKMNAYKNKYFNFDALGGKNTTILHASKGLNNAIKQSINFVNKCLSRYNSSYTGGLFEASPSETLSEYIGENMIFFPKIDLSNVTNFYSCFEFNRSLIYIPQLDTSNSDGNMQFMFCECKSLTEVPLFDTSKVTQMMCMFRDCYSLTTIPQLNTSKVTDMMWMFYNCYSLESVPLLDASNVADAYDMFYNCDKLQNLGGFKNLGKVDNINVIYAFRGCHNITRQSCVNIFNNLYDIASAGYLLKQYLGFEAEVIARLSDEDIAIATNKGWNIVVN